MIRSSRLMLSTSVVTAVALHVAVAWLSDTGGAVETEGGAGAAEAVLGSSFADMVQGAAQPVSDSTVTPNREPAEVVKPVEGAHTLLPAAPEPVQAHATASVSAEPTLRAEVVSAVIPRKVSTAEPDRGEGLQAARRPEARPVTVEQAATTRQAPEPERRVEVRGNSGSNAVRDANRGSATGAETATATRAAHDPGRESEAEGNTAASNYPGQVLQKLAGVPRPRSSTRGTVLVQFRVADSGGLDWVSVARSSGSTRLDRDALSVVQRAAPFPKPPQGAQRSFSVQIKGQ